MTGPIVSRGRSLRELVPAAYLLRDADPLGGNGMLGALLDLLDAEIATVEDELGQAYAALFVETCSDDDLEHFQALLGLTQLPGNQHPRALIGNIIEYRRGKGTTTTLERVAAATTGWSAHAVDYFRLLVTTQNVNHLRPAATTVPVRDPEPLQWAGSSFDPLAHSVDVRARGRYDIPDVGVHLWRLAPVTTVSPSDAAPTADPLRFRFHPLGIDTPLHSIGRSLDALGDAAVAPVDVTQPIRILQLRDALEDYYGADAGQSICVFDDGVAVPAAQVSVRPLDDRSSGAWGTAPPTTRVAIDPVRGRLAFAATPEGPVTVRFVRARPGEIGSRDVADPAAATTVVDRGDPSALGNALAALPGAGGIVELAGSGRFVPPAGLSVAAGAVVTVRASSGNWPTLEPAAAPIVCADGSALTLTGLLVTGAPLRITGSPAALTLDRCTIIGTSLDPDGTPQQPDAPALVLDLDADAGTAVTLTGCVTGPVRVAAPDVTVTITDSVVAGASGPGTAVAEPVLVGAALAPFPDWPGGVSRLRLHVGVETTLDLKLATAPATVADAAAALRAALTTVALDPTVTTALDVTTVGVDVPADRLVITVPGAAEVSAADVSDTDTAATLLGLTTAVGGYSAWSRRGDRVPDPPTPPSLPARLAVEIGPPGLDTAAIEVEITTQPASLTDLATALETALRDAAGTPPLVLSDAARLQVVPGGAGESVRFLDGPAVRAWGLYGPAPLLAGSSDGLVPAPATTVERTTVLGGLYVAESTVSDSIITGAVVADRRQVGCVRYSYLDPASLTPRQYRCIGPQTAGPVRFTSLRLGAAGFAQLTADSPDAIARGSDDGSELGAFCSLRAPLRLAAVQSLLSEYLRLTAAGGVFVES